MRELTYGSVEYKTEPMEGLDFFCREVELPMTINGVTVEDSDGTYCVYINSLKSEEDKRCAYLHEVIHIREDHFHQPGRTEEELEAETEHLLKEEKHKYKYTSYSFQ